MTDEIKRTERGWAGHFILGHRCAFRRNTLLELGEYRVVVSTIGVVVLDEKNEQVGLDRWYETTAFFAEAETSPKFEGVIYFDSDVTRPFDFDSKCSIDRYDFATDAEANDMHEAAVTEIAARMMEESERKDEPKCQT